MYILACLVNGAENIDGKTRAKHINTHKINDELRSTKSNLSNGSKHIHFLFLFQLLDDVSGAAVDTGLLTTVPRVRYTYMYAMNREYEKAHICTCTQVIHVHTAAAFTAN